MRRASSSRSRVTGRSADGLVGEADADGSLMAEQKPGFFKRLFGGERTAGPPAGGPMTHEPAPPEAPPPSRDAAPKPSWFQRLASGLKRSSDQLTGGIAAVFTKKKLDQAMLDELEDVLIQADFGIDMASRDHRRRCAATASTATSRPMKCAPCWPPRSRRCSAPVAQPLVIDAAQKPFVILMVGVNGSGKTTTIGKLASLYGAAGQVGDAGRRRHVPRRRDRAAAGLGPAHRRAGGRAAAGSDAVGPRLRRADRGAGAQGRDMLIIDTAGRLQNRDELMGELEKIIRVIKKVDPSAPHATLLTLDATTGQNALNQVEIFGKRAGVTGLVMTKLDGTARGGILVAIAKKFGLPVHFIGVGEGVDNLEPFAAADFARAIVGEV